MGGEEEIKDADEDKHRGQTHHHGNKNDSLLQWLPTVTGDDGVRRGGGVFIIQ